MAQTTRPEVPRPSGAPPFAVLVIDGNEEHQILSVAALTRRGGLVRTAASGRQALQLAMGQHFDVLVIGSKLRDSTGVEVLQLLAERFPAIPKIFVVPPDGEEAALQALKSGATSYIVKTPRYTELLPAIVLEIVAESKARKQLAQSEQTQAKAVTEKRSAEERLSQSENRLRLILQQAPVLLWSTDGDLHVTSAMGGGFRTLDTSRSQERGLTLFDYFSVRDEDVEPIASHRRALGGERVATQIEWQGRTYDVHIEPLRSSGPSASRSMSPNARGPRRPCGEARSASSCSDGRRATSSGTGTSRRMGSGPTRTSPKSSATRPRRSSPPVPGGPTTCIPKTANGSSRASTRSCGVAVPCGPRNTGSAAGTGRTRRSWTGATCSTIPPAIRSVSSAPRWT